LYKYFQLVAYLVKPQKAQFPGIYHNLIMSILLLEMLPLLLSSNLSQWTLHSLHTCMCFLGFLKTPLYQDMIFIEVLLSRIKSLIGLNSCIGSGWLFRFFNADYWILAFYKYFGLSSFKNPLILNMKWVHQYASDAVVVCPYFNL
jgi:hypothetical protein